MLSQCTKESREEVLRFPASLWWRTRCLYSIIDKGSWLQFTLISPWKLCLLDYISCCSKILFKILHCAFRLLRLDSKNQSEVIGRSDARNDVHKSSVHHPTISIVGSFSYACNLLSHFFRISLLILFNFSSPSFHQMSPWLFYLPHPPFFGTLTITHLWLVPLPVGK